jgi:hypothetical protein
MPRSRPPEQIGEQSPELRLAFENVAFGEPDLQGSSGAGPGGRGRLHALPAGGADRGRAHLGPKATTDILSWAGPTVDENAARFRVLYDQVRLRGIGRPELAQLADFYYRTMAALDAFAPANRAFASTAAQLVAAVTATVVVSAASGGSLGPVAVGALAAFVGGASAGLTGAVIRGQSTDAEVLTDVATGAVEGGSVVGSALARGPCMAPPPAGRPAQAARMAGGQRCAPPPAAPAQRSPKRSSTGPSAARRASSSRRPSTKPPGIGAWRRPLPP